MIFTVCDMRGFCEQQVCITFYLKLGKQRLHNAIKWWRPLSRNRLWVGSRHLIGFPAFRRAEYRLMMVNALVDQCPVQRQKWLRECVEVLRLLRENERRKWPDKMAEENMASPSWQCTSPCCPPDSRVVLLVTIWLWCHIFLIHHILHPETFSCF